MASFDTAVKTVLSHEGGYVNDINDPGGETNFGISKRQYPNLDIKNLTQAEAINIYKQDYWDPLWERIDSQQIATQLFDLAVNAGTTTAIMIFQKAIRSLVVGPFVVDGKLGPKTLETANGLDAKQLLIEFKAHTAVHYALTVLAHPNQAGFLLNWMRREIEI